MYNGLPYMKLIPEICQGISTALFAGYGFSCFLSRTMIAEFDRYRLTGQRVLTGVLQIAGAAGLVVGYFNRPILLLSSGGLARMMLLAVVTRFRIRDPLYAAIPAISLFLLNSYIFGAAL